MPGAAAVSGSIDVAATFRSRDALTGGWDDSGQVSWLDSHGVDLVRGIGCLVGERSVDVEASDGSIRHLAARRAVVVATGTRAALPPIDGLAEARPWENRDITATHDVPGRLVVLGGGPIGVEMAQAFARYGSSVTVVEMLPRLLAREEPFASDEVQTALADESVRVLTGVIVARVERNSHGEVVLALAEGPDVVGDELLVAAGRRPSTEELGLATVGLESGRPITVDDQLRATGVDGGWLFAVGDCNGRSLLTHMGKYQGRIAADVHLRQGRRSDSGPRHRPPRDVQRPSGVRGRPHRAAGARGRPRRARRALRHRWRRRGRRSRPQLPGHEPAGRGRGAARARRGDVRRSRRAGAAPLGTIAIAGEVALDRLWHAVPAFPTVSEVWLRLLETYGL